MSPSRLGIVLLIDSLLLLREDPDCPDMRRLGSSLVSPLLHLCLTPSPPEICSSASMQAFTTRQFLSCNKGAKRSTSAALEPIKPMACEASARTSGSSSSSHPRTIDNKVSSPLGPKRIKASAAARRDSIWYPASSGGSTSCSCAWTAPPGSGRWFPAASQRLSRAHSRTTFRRSSSAWACAAKAPRCPVAAAGVKRCRAVSLNGCSVRVRPSLRVVRSFFTLSWWEPCFFSKR
mmetsp:Transcript_68613/g.151028  ORF Transcript_68613/g.151028 Transcript_68613/m.151028 type:complete len:234 (-) Transcript_68613:197-898(-)